MAADAALDLSRFDATVLDDSATPYAVRFAMARLAAGLAPDWPGRKTVRCRQAAEYGRRLGTRRGDRSDDVLRDLAGVAA